MSGLTLMVMFLEQKIVLQLPPCGGAQAKPCIEHHGAVLLLQIVSSGCLVQVLPPFSPMAARMLIREIASSPVGHVQPITRLGLRKQGPVSGLTLACMLHTMHCCPWGTGTKSRLEAAG